MSRLDSKFSLHRLEALTDGIYAIAMTLLVLSLPLPQTESVTDNSDIISHLTDSVDLFTSYALSFMLLGCFWIMQLKIFRYIKSSCIPHIWANLGGLLFICLIPFTSSLMGYHNHTFHANLMFHVNIFIITFFFTLQCRILLRYPETVADQFDESAIKRIIRINLILPFVSFAGVLVSLIWPDWSSLVYITVPVLTTRAKKKLGNGGAEL